LSFEEGVSSLGKKKKEPPKLYNSKKPKRKRRKREHLQREKSLSMNSQGGIATRFTNHIESVRVREKREEAQIA